MKIEQLQGSTPDIQDKSLVLVEKNLREFAYDRHSDSITVKTRCTETYTRRKGQEPIVTYHWYEITCTAKELQQMLALRSFVREDMP